MASQALAAVLDRMTTRVSLNSIAQVTELCSHNTESRYLEALEDSFLLLIVHQLELHRRRAALRGQRKVYASDPLLLHAVRGWTLGGTGYLELSRELPGTGGGRGMMAEALVASHLARQARRLQPSDIHCTRGEAVLLEEEGDGKGGRPVVLEGVVPPHRRGAPDARTGISRAGQGRWGGPGPRRGRSWGAGQGLQYPGPPLVRPHPVAMPP